MTSDHKPSQREPENEADRRFVASLLEHHFHGQQSEDAGRIAAALGKLEGQPEAKGQTPSLARWIRRGQQLAAALLVGALIVIPVSLSNTATAAIDRARIAMSRLSDQHYRLQVKAPMGVTMSGEIWFRGAELLALRLDDFDDELWAGEGRDSAWVVPPSPERPVEVVEKGTLRGALRVQEDAPLLRLSTILDRLSESFEFEYSEDGKTIAARRIVEAPDDLPDQVELRIAPDGIVREFTARWSTFLGPRACRLTWIDDAVLPASFYEHSAHHSVDREVVDLR